ncbi:MAG: hypothetical protein RLZZ175_3064 [Bacteroidota bacterium]|jgi:hypothetical protein
MTNLEEKTFHYYLKQRNKGIPFSKIKQKMIKNKSFQILELRTEKAWNSFQFSEKNINKLSDVNNQLREKELNLIDEFNLIKESFKNHLNAKEIEVELEIIVYINEKYKYYKISDDIDFKQSIGINDNLDIFNEDDWKEPWMPIETNNIKFCYSMHCLIALGHSPMITWQELTQINRIETQINIKLPNALQPIP